MTKLIFKHLFSRIGRFHKLEKRNIYIYIYIFFLVYCSSLNMAGVLFVTAKEAMHARTAVFVKLFVSIKFHYNGLDWQFNQNSFLLFIECNQCNLDQCLNAYLKFLKKNFFSASVAMKMAWKCTKFAINNNFFRLK